MNHRSAAESSNSILSRIKLLLNWLQWTSLAEEQKSKVKPEDGGEEREEEKAVDNEPC